MEMKEPSVFGFVDVGRCGPVDRTLALVLILVWEKSGNLFTAFGAHDGKRTQISSVWVDCPKQAGHDKELRMIAVRHPGLISKLRDFRCY